MKLEAGPGREGVGACPQPSAQTHVPPSYLGAVLFLRLSPHSWGLRLLTCGRCCGTQGAFHVLKGTQRWPKANTHPSTAAFKEALATVTDFPFPGSVPPLFLQISNSRFPLGPQWPCISPSGFKGHQAVPPTGGAYHSLQLHFPLT